MGLFVFGMINTSKILREREREFQSWLNLWLISYTTSSFCQREKLWAGGSSSRLNWLQCRTEAALLSFNTDSLLFVRNRFWRTNLKRSLNLFVLVKHYRAFDVLTSVDQTSVHISSLTSTIIPLFSPYMPNKPTKWQHPAMSGPLSGPLKRIFSDF